MKKQTVDNSFFNLFFVIVKYKLKSFKTEIFYQSLKNSQTQSSYEHKTKYTI